MFPIFGGFIFGRVLRSWFMENREFNENFTVAPWLKNEEQKYSDFKAENVLDFIKIYEEGGMKKVKTAAYQNLGDRPTIGFGTADLFNSKGIWVRKVKIGDTLAGLRREFGITHLDDIKTGEFFILNYMKRPDGYVRIAKLLDDHGVAFNYALAIGLYDFSYNSGGAFKGGNRNLNFVNEVKNANAWNLEKIAMAYTRMRMGYLYTNINEPFYSRNIRGWMRRIYHITLRILQDNKNVMDYGKLRVEEARKGFFERLGYNVVLKK